MLQLFEHGTLPLTKLLPAYQSRFGGRILTVAELCPPGFRPKLRALVAELLPKLKIVDCPELSMHTRCDEKGVVLAVSQRFEAMITHRIFDFFIADW